MYLIGASVHLQRGAYRPPVQGGPGLHRQHGEEIHRGGGSQVSRPLSPDTWDL